MSNNFVSVVEAAKIQGVSRQAIYLAIRLNRLRSYKNGNKVRIFLQDLDAYNQKKWNRVYHSTLHNGKPIYNENEGYFSVDKAAALLNMSKQKVYYAIRTKKLKASRCRCALVVHVNDLFIYQKKYLKHNFTNQISVA